MRLFNRRVPPPGGEETSPANPHPAYRLGAWVRAFITRHEKGVADFMNKGQHRIGFRIRNSLLGLLGLIFLLYFIALLSQ